MMTFQEQKEIKLVTLRKLEEMQQLGTTDFERPFRSPSKDLYQRLHSEDLKKIKLSATEQDNLVKKKSPGTSRTREELV